MVISASRRTDIPAYYTPWLLHRMREGYCLTTNPMNRTQIRRVDLREAEAFVFWTKNPLPLLDHLDVFRDRVYYFQWTMTSYGKDLEPNVPQKSKVLIPAMQELARRIGKERIVWRYDPILISEKYSPDYHIRYFERMADRMYDSMDGCVISFLDPYTKIQSAMKRLGFREPNAEEVAQIAESLARIAKERGIRLTTCSETMDLTPYGIGHGACIDGQRLIRLGYQGKITRDRNQRPACLCASAVDIGAYCSCPNGCRYCYANGSQARALGNHDSHDPKGEFLLRG